MSAKERVLKIIERILYRERCPIIAGVYTSRGKCMEAVLRLKEKGFDRLVVYSPLPLHDDAETSGRVPGIVGYFTLIGGAAGAAGGFFLAFLTSIKWGLITGGKPVISIPPFLIIAFEGAILLAAIATLAGFLYSSGFPRLKLDEVYNKKFGEDRFGVGVICDDSELGRAEEVLRESGAEEVYRAAT